MYFENPLYGEWQAIILMADNKQRKTAKIDYYFKAITRVSNQQEFVELAHKIMLDDDLNMDEKKYISNVMNMRIMLTIASSKKLSITGVIEETR